MKYGSFSKAVIAVVMAVKNIPRITSATIPTIDFLLYLGENRIGIQKSQPSNRFKI